MQNNDRALPRISLAGRGQMLITLEPHGICCLDTGMQSHGQLVKMPITLEPHGIFSLNLAYSYILRLSSVYQTKLNNNRQEK